MASRTNIAKLILKQNKLNSTVLSSTTTSSSRAFASWEPRDIETHTGQTFEPDDKRLARFVDRPKVVNPNWAINLIAEVPPAAKKSRVVFCDGGDGPLGHPRVYINLDKPGNHACGYCGLRFYKEDHHH